MSLHPAPVHATAVALPVPAGIGRRGADAPLAAVLLRGASGSGKSDLALRLITRHGARLIADDQVIMQAQDGQVVCTAPAAIAGMIEIRGVGLVRVSETSGVALALVVDLVARNAVERLPAGARATLCNIPVPLVRLHAFDDSAADKVMAALAVVKHPELIVG